MTNQGARKPNLEELEEVRALRIAYCARYDEKDLDSLVDLFCEDAVCHFPEQFGGDWVGRATIAANFADYIGMTDKPFDAIHVVTNPLIVFDGETTASGRWYMRTYLNRQKDVGPLRTAKGHEDPLFNTGIYEDRYRRVDGVWKIARTRLSLLWPIREFEAFLA